MKRNKAILKNWEKETQKIADYFLKKYFKGYDPEWWWVADLVGEILFVNDYFFNLERIVEAIRFDASEKDLFDFYELELDCIIKGKQVDTNFYYYLKQHENKKG